MRLLNHRGAPISAAVPMTLTEEGTLSDMETKASMVETKKMVFLLLQGVRISHQCWRSKYLEDGIL